MNQTNAKNYLVGPYADFILLGGASLLLIPLGLLFEPAGGQWTAIFVFSYFVADILNHPHFAASYVLFYRTFKDKVTNHAEFSAWFRFRCLFAGVLVPLFMLAYFAYAIYTDNLLLLGYAANAMVFLVGWHYTKQGYGMLIVDSVLKRQFYSALEKRILLVNGFMFWLLTWSYINMVASQSQMWGVQYYALPIPDLVVTIFGAIALVTGLAAAILLLRRLLQKTKQTAWTGVMAYLVSVYFWLVGRINPVMLLFIPAFHSLQYLTVVYAFERNRTEKSIEQTAEVISAKKYLFRFLLLLIVIGFAGFWFLPSVLEGTNVRTEYVETAVYAFSFWVFINIHHYFIDNVLWKRENPEVKDYLFS